MLTGKTLLGAGWSVSTRLAARLIDLVTLLVLARVLSPADFGLTALATTLVAIVETVLEIALIQALTRLPSVEKSHLDTAFTLGLLRGLVFALVIIAAAFPFAYLYHDDRLILLVAVLSLAPLARGFYSPGMVKFFRELSFRESFMIQTAAKVVAAVVAVAVLFLGGGYWAIAVNTVVAAVGATILSYIIAPYRPGISLKERSYFLGFLGWFSLSQLMSAINWQLDRVLLGNFITKAELGRYTMASDLATMPTQSVIGPAMQPVMAAFSKISTDVTRLRSAYLKAARLTMMIAMPACLLIAMTADQLVQILFTPEWAGAAPYLQWIAITMLPAAYAQPLASMAVAMNSTRILFTLQAMELTLRIVLLCAGYFLFAIWGLIAARGVLALIVFAANIVMARKLIGSTIAEQLRNLTEVALACLAMAAAMAFLERYMVSANMPFLMIFAACVITGGAVYVLTLLACGVRLLALAGLRR